MRSLSEAPRYASVIATILRQSYSEEATTHKEFNENISTQGVQMQILVIFFVYLEREGGGVCIR